ncbi:MAG: rod shape-determining protein MreC [candidate division Zixibacteria bacterium]|nr:rod shape-determining protein MreC [candidate division Zixibacteria bacterium]
MKWVTSLLYRNKRFSLFLAGLLFSLTLFALPLNQKTFVCNVLQNIFYWPYWSTAGIVAKVISVHEVNTALQAELVRLKLERITFEENKLENERFREMLEFLPVAEFEIIPAHVIAYDQGRRSSSLAIKGNRELGRFLPVVDESGLVGKISASTGRVATVSLLIGPNCRVAARDKQTRSLGIVKWQSGRDLYLDDVALDNKVVIGDTLISSGLGGVFPKGLIIGVVTGVSSKPSRFFREITVKPAVDFGSLDNVMVLKPKSEPSGD